MNIIRAPRGRPFTAIDSDAVNDERLSFRSRGLLVWLLDKPDDWSIDWDKIAAGGPEGRGAVRAALLELEAIGYLARVRVQTADGRWSTTGLTVHEKPLVESTRYRYTLEAAASKNGEEVAT